MKRIVTLNIESSPTGQKHRDRYMPVLKKLKPDFLAVQEIFKQDVQDFESELGLMGNFVPMHHVDVPHENQRGIAMFSRYEPFMGSHIYFGDFSDDADPNKVVFGEPMRAAVQTLSFDTDEGWYYISNHHGTYFPDGYQISDLQRQNMDKLIGLTDVLPNLILAGDFNTRRGDELWGILTSRFQDNLPANVKSTLDPELHRAGKRVQFAIDSIFTRGYRVLSSWTIFEVSDHCAVVAEIELPEKGCS